MTDAEYWMRCEHPALTTNFSSGPTRTTCDRCHRVVVFTRRHATPAHRHKLRRKYHFPGCASPQRTMLAFRSLAIGIHVARSNAQRMLRHARAFVQPPDLGCICTEEGCPG